MVGHLINRNLMKICTIIGARPQFIKSSVVSKSIASSRTIKEIIIHTGQHFDKNMSNIFFDEMEMRKPDYNLGINSLSEGAMIGRQLEEIEHILKNERPDGVIVYGDTNSTLSGALAAAHLCIPIFHIESGLRSFNKEMPEEINRILTDHLSSICFVPSQNAYENLIKEGISSSNIFDVGDVMYDASIHFGRLAKSKSVILNKLNIKPFNYILATIHRKDNTDNESNLKNIFFAFEEIGEKIILPLHPRTKKALKDYNIVPKKNIKVIDPVGYLDMLTLEENSLKIITDSGGVQKEAYFFKKPCIIIRNETEWIEIVDKKMGILVGNKKDKIIQAVNNFNPNIFDRNLFGNGHACKLIIKTIGSFF